jgi:Domain of unknown function (DUF6916)
MEATVDLGSVTAGTFAPYRDSEFRLEALNGLVTDEPVLRLRAINRHGLQPTAPRPEPFSLVFAGPADPRLEQRVYRLRHPDLGAFELFLVPIGYDPEDGLLYEAVFN